MISTFTYELGDLISVKDPLNRETKRIQDAAGRLRSIINPLGQKTVRKRPVDRDSHKEKFWPALPLPGFDDEMGYALKVGEVIRDQCALGVQCRGGNEQVRIRQQGSLTMEVAIQRSGAFHHLIGEREDETGLAQEGKRGFLRSCVFCLQPAQQFVAGNDRKGEALVVSKICAHPLHDEGMLFEEFGENIGVEQDRRLGHQAAGSRKKCRRSKAIASTWAISCVVKPW